MGRPELGPNLIFLSKADEAGVGGNGQGAARRPANGKNGTHPPLEGPHIDFEQIKLCHQNNKWHKEKLSLLDE